MTWSSVIGSRLLNFDLHIHPSGQIEFCERVHRLRARIEDVDQALVRLELELLAALLVDVRAAQHRPELPLRGQWNRTRDLCTGLFRGPHDVRGRLVDQRMIERFEPNPNLAGHWFLVTSRFS